MKGIVFTEFMDMVEDVFSPEVLDLIIEKSDLPNGGAYTSVGVYDHQEIVRMTQNLSEHSHIPVAELLEAFGQHLFGRFVVSFPGFFENQKDSFEFLKQIDSYIHIEVKKLYPDAQLPRFFHEQINQQTLVLYYISSRHFEDLAVGLIKGCMLHFKDEGNVSRELCSYKDQQAIKMTIELAHA